MHGVKWFSSVSLILVEKLLRYCDDRTALIFKGKKPLSIRTSYTDLYEEVDNNRRVPERREHQAQITRYSPQTIVRHAGWATRA